MSDCDKYNKGKTSEEMVDGFVNFVFFVIGEKTRMNSVKFTNVKFDCFTLSSHHSLPYSESI